MSAVDSEEGAAPAYRLARHVPQIAIDWLAETPELRWRSVPGSAVFADISGFTALSERLATRGRIGAEELVETLSHVFGRMLDTAAGRGGQLLKFGGDALLFLFPAEGDDDDHAARAACTAVEMRRELRRASDIVTSVGRLSLSISIGVHTGDFDLFLVGEPHRELVTIGPGFDAVLHAESTAVAGQILVTPSAAAALPPSAARPRDDGLCELTWRRPPASVGMPRPTSTGDDHEEFARRLLPSILHRPFDGVRPDPAHRVASISFMRFSGADAVLAGPGPQELGDRLHELLRIAQTAFEAEDVALLCVDLDTDGGKLFCCSGVPVTSEDDEGRLLRAAAAILRAGPPLPLQIGVNRGHVFAAEVGTPRRAAFSAMGDTTNTAARICAKTSPGEIYVHPTVLEHSRTLYAAEPVGPFTFKGKAQPQLLYRLGDEIGPRPVGGDDDLPLLGRDAELARLRDLLGAALDGAGGALEVRGALGVGKSRLVREALRLVAPAMKLRLNAEPYGATSAYRVLRDPVRGLLGVERGAPEAMADAVRVCAARLLPELGPLLPLLGDLAGVDVGTTPEVDAILPQFRPDRTADVLIDLLDAIGPASLVISMEDAQWADESSARVLERLGEAASVRPWALVVARRDDDSSDSGDDPVAAANGEVAVGEVAVGEVAVGEVAVGGATGDDMTGREPIVLGPLADAAIRSIVLSATEVAPLRPHEIDQIVVRAAGNPLFALQLVEAVQELGSIDAVPTSLQGAMAAQVDALDPLARRVLSYASVLGRSFRRSVLDEVLRTQRIEVDAATLDRLTRFLGPDGPERWRFRSGLVRDVTYEGLGYRLRAQLHLEAGNAVERISTDPEADAATLALHFGEGGDHPRTYRYAELAASRAERSFATADAVAQLERAVEAARRLPELADAERRRLWLRLGEARDQAGLLGPALDAFRSATSLSPDPVERAEVLLRRARVRMRAGSFSAALREATSAQRRVEGLDDEAAGRVLAASTAFAATVRQRQERTDDARRLAQRAVVEADRSGERAALARAHGVMAWAGLMQGRDDVLESATTALQLFEEVGDLVGEADMANNLGGYAYFRGEWEETLDWYARSEAACRRTGNVIDAALTSANTAEVLVNQGRLDEAEPLLIDASRVLRVSGLRWGAAFADMHLGRLLTARREYVQAEVLLRACIDDSAAMGSAASAYEASIHLGACLVATGRAHGALDAIATAARRTDPEEVAMFDAARALVEANAYAALGRFAEAILALSTGLTAARSRGLGYDEARLLLLAERLGVNASGGLDAAGAGARARELLRSLGVRPGTVLR